MSNEVSQIVICMFQMGGLLNRMSKKVCNRIILAKIMTCKLIFH